MFFQISKECLLRLPTTVSLEMAKISFNASKKGFPSITSHLSFAHLQVDEKLLESSVSVIVWGSEQAVADALDAFQDVIPDMVSFQILLLHFEIILSLAFTLISVVFLREKRSENCSGKLCISILVFFVY